MNIFDLNEKEFDEVLEKKLSKVSPEELLNELIECGLELKEEITIYDKAQYEYVQELPCAEAIWYSIKTTGWTNIKQKLSGKIDEDKKLKEAA